MDYLKIVGKTRLSGEVTISGSKNSALPLIAFSILVNGRFHISNAPDVADIRTLKKLLKKLGAEAEFVDGDIYIDTSSISSTIATYDIVRTMRASILVLGPLLTRFGHCKVSLPGGCAIGLRPVDLHLKALQKMGANIEIQNGYIVADAPNGLKGAEIFFEKKTVTGTENILMAAALAKGKTILRNCSIEPEVVQLCEVLKKAGVDITGIGTEEIEIVGTDGELLSVDEVRVIPDRIEAGTYLCAGAITNSRIAIKSVIPEHLGAILEKLQEMGFRLHVSGDRIDIHPANRIEPVEISTAEYPLFPTDMQAQFTALATQASGVSIIEERLFENRFMHINELQRLGANIRVNRNIVTVRGGIELLGADVMATDLRASSALVLAGLIAKGETRIHRIYHLDRGYEKLEWKLSRLGARIERLQEK